MPVDGLTNLATGTEYHGTGSTYEVSLATMDLPLTIHRTSVPLGTESISVKTAQPFMSQHHLDPSHFPNLYVAQLLSN